MERRFLEGFGLDKPAIDQIMQVNGEDIEHQKKIVKSVREALEQTQEALAQAEEKLAQGNAEGQQALQEQVAQLEAALQERQAEFDRQMAERDFGELLAAEMTAAGAKNHKAVAALLDTAALRDSDDPAQAVRAALIEIRAGESYMFSAEAESTPVVVSTGARHSEPGSVEADGFTQAAMRGAGLSNTEG